MTEASVFYEAASVGLGSDFLDDVQRVVDTLREHPELGRAVGKGLASSATPFPVQSHLFDRERRNHRGRSCASTATPRLLERQE